MCCPLSSEPEGGGLFGGTMKDLFGHDKVEMSIERLRTFEPPEGYYVAFSGGKDSIVILDLVKRSGVKYDAHYNVTGIDPPELVRFIRDHHPEVERCRMGVTIWSLIRHKMMPPTQLTRFCCEHLKEPGGNGRRVVTGVRWEESTRRSKRKMDEFCIKSNRKEFLHAIIDWSKQEVWQYIRERKLAYCSLYDEGFLRLGCIGCPNGNRKRDFLRWPRFKKLYIRTFQQAVDIRKRRSLEDPVWGEKHSVSVDWSTGEAMFDWWMSSKLADNPDQTVLFE
jgi:phosphoadenosine phosphosulfate reductase